MIVLGYMDLDYAMRFDRPANLNETSLNEQKSANEKWEQSNCMSSMMMQHSIPKSLKGSLTENKNVKGFLKEITDQFAAIEKVETKVETELGKKIKVVKSDRRGEYYGRYDGSEHDFEMRLEEDPIIVSQAKSCQNSTKWAEAMKNELNSMKDNGV
ncbi:hypothetical protein FXO38_06158 [Capsicum annuum]|nr:hypothetical protein FXO38_06158 [Capsicum annuum]